MEMTPLFDPFFTYKRPSLAPSLPLLSTPNTYPSLSLSFACLWWVMNIRNPRPMCVKCVVPTRSWQEYTAISATKVGHSTLSLPPSPLPTTHTDTYIHTYTFSYIYIYTHSYRFDSMPSNLPSHHPFFTYLLTHFSPTFSPTFHPPPPPQCTEDLCRPCSRRLHAHATMEQHVLEGI